MYRFPTVFAVSLHYELFYALQTVSDPDSRIHSGWKETVLQRLPSAFHDRFSQLGASPFLWACVPDTVENETESRDFDGLLSEMNRVQPRLYQERILLGVLHDSKLVDQMLEGGRSLFDGVADVRKTKQEWLAFIGLYPYQKQAPMVKALELLLRSPEEFRKDVQWLIKTFWKSAFQATWMNLQPQLLKSMEEKERLYQSCSLEEFSKIALLRIEIDENRGLLRAVRGGYRLPLKNIAAAYFFPSCFNDKRHWTCYGPDDRTTVCFPYFDPSLSPDFGKARVDRPIVDPELDPALIFAALGDSTRFGIVSLLARAPANSAELSRQLALSRPTVSHHIHVLREAGLLYEEQDGTSVRLSVNRNALEHLSDLIVDKLFHSSNELQIRKSRKA
jgi:ArsR family transcriptional regulator, repressor of sdpIR and other operons